MSAILIGTYLGILRHTRNDYTARWICLAAISVTAMAGLSALGISVLAGSLVSQLEWPALFLAFAVAYRVVGMQVPRFEIPFTVASDFLLSVSQLLTGMIVLLPLSYLAATPAFPLLDAKLSALDALLFGFDWDIAARWVAGYPTLERTLGWAYYSFTYQAAVVLLIGSIARPWDRNGEFIWSFGFASILTCAVFVFTPALGKVDHLAYVETLTAIRGGQWTIFDYTRAQGIVSFPSFHTSVAILFLYAARRNLLVLVVLIPFNVLLIAATLPIGGHYLVDLPAGAAVAILSIAATQLVRHHLPAANPCVQARSMTVRRFRF